MQPGLGLKIFRCANYNLYPLITKRRNKMFGWIRTLFNDQIDSLKSLWANKRQLTFQGLNLAMVVFSALMIWKGLMFITHSESPVVVVLSGSMEPAFQRGDILFLTNFDNPIEVGEIVVFKVAGRDIPIVHRVLRVHERKLLTEGSIPDYVMPWSLNAANYSATGGEDYLTKGDNNSIDDRNLYAPGQLWLQRSEVLGRVVASLPYVGMVTILLNDYPAFKFVVVGLMGVFVLTSKEG